MAVLLVAALIGGLGTYALFSPYGTLAALLGASIGGSCFALAAGLFLASRSSRAKRKLEQRHEAPLDKPKASV